MMTKRTEERGARMMIQRMMLLLLASTLVLMGTGCGEEELTNAPSAADMKADRAKLASRDKSGKRGRRGKKGKAAKSAPAAKSSGTEYAAGEQDYFYDPRQKRDPFRSFRFANVEDDGSEKNFGPLGDFELGQLELSAVIWDAGNPRALILDPGGRSYIVREGAQIGKNSGQVIHIGDNLVLVKETYENFAGERTTKDVELRIRLSQGG